MAEISSLSFFMICGNAGNLFADDDLYMCVYLFNRNLVVRPQHSFRSYAKIRKANANIG